MRFTISVIDSDGTKQADLRGGRSPWFATAQHAARLDLSENVKCDALIVGGGITGSLIAERLTRQGLDVVIIDRELPGRGSTAASTSMLLWEIDRSLTQLTEIYGFERASRAYLASLHAVTGLKSLVRHLALPCEMRDKDSLYLAAGSNGKELLRENKLRERAGLPGDFLDHAMLLDIFGITRAGAIVSPGAADADPMQLAHGMLRVAVARGARVFEGEAVEYDAATRSVGVQLKNGCQIEARSVVLATGYVMPPIIRPTIKTVSSSWAIATTSQPQNIWKGGALIWEDSKEYRLCRGNWLWNGDWLWNGHSPWSLFGFNSVCVSANCDTQQLHRCFCARASTWCSPKCADRRTISRDGFGSRLNHSWSRWRLHKNSRNGSGLFRLCSVKHAEPDRSCVGEW